MKMQVYSSSGTSSVEREYNILKQLCSNSSATLVGIPRVHWFGRESKFDVMVLDLLGPSLHDLVTVRGKFHPLTVRYVGSQLVRTKFDHTELAH